MKSEILLLLQILLVFTSCYARSHTGGSCQSNSDCDSWLTCIDGVCTACRPSGSVCDPNGTGFLSQCCSGTTCEPIPGLNHTSQCMANNNRCLTDEDCSYGLFCLKRLDKCGLCHPNGMKCTLPFDTLECCSSYCKIQDDTGNAICGDPNPVTTTRQPIYCEDGNQCGIHMCINNRCSQCQNINTLCETDSDCCQSRYSNIVCAVANHKQDIVGYHIYNRKICTIV